MAESSSGGFSGEWKDLKNIPDLPIGKSTAEIDAAHNNFVGSIAETQFNAGLALLGYKDGQYWIYESGANDSGVKSQTNTEMDAGNLKLTKKWITQDNWEDGDKSEWTGDTGTLTVTTSAIEGSYSGEVTSTGGNNRVSFSNWSNTSEEVRWVSRFPSIDPNGYNCRAFLMGDGSGEVGYINADPRSPNIEFIASDTTTLLNEMKADKDYKIRIVPDWDNSTVDIYINGSLVGDNLSIGSGHTQFTGFDFGAYSSGSTMTHRIDSIENKGGYHTSGSATLNSKTYDNTPQTVVVSDEATLNGQSRSYDIFDGNDNLLTTVTASEIDTEVSISPANATLYAKANLSSDGSSTPEIDRAELAVNY